MSTHIYFHEEVRKNIQWIPPLIQSYVLCKHPMMSVSQINRDHLSIRSLLLNRIFLLSSENRV